MSARRRATRLLALVFAVAQLVMPAASAVADGLASKDATPVGHAESRTSASCAVVHSPDCGVCRYLSSQSAPTGAALPPVLRRGRADITAALAQAGARPALVLPSPRAPPPNV